jgi:peptidyl-prolyl cis-trans isomerase SurA
VSGLLLAVAVAGLAACRTAPSVAAYVGEEQVTVSELEAAVEERLADAEVAAYAADREGEFDRRVLSLLVQEQVYAVAAERYDVQVTDAAVRARIDELLGNDDPDTVYSQLAQQGIGREDVFENVRQQLFRQEFAFARGEVEQPSDEDLRARYEEVRQDRGQIRFGYVTVPDQATADAVAAQLEADPAAYPQVAAQYPGPTTLPELDERTLEEVPAPLTEQLTAAQPNTAFTLAVPEVQGVLVTFVEGAVYPSFEDLRPELEQETTEAADAAGSALVDEVRADLDVAVNPRYGVLQDTGELAPADGGVVDILGDEDPASAAPGGAGD